jgi:hypothetical protein
MKKLTLFAALILWFAQCWGQSLASVENPLENAGRSDKPKHIRIAPWYVERFKVTAGFFLPVNNTNIRVDGSQGRIGTDIDFENDLGFQTTTSTFLADFQWRASSRSRFDLSYYHINRSSNHTLDKTIYFGNDTFNINTNIHAFFNTDIYRFSYGYAILSDPKYEVGLLIGAHVIGLSVGMGVNGQNVNAEVSQDYKITAPLPDFGIWGGYAFSGRWAINAEFNWLNVTIDNINGRILGGNISVMYKIINHLTASVGYTGLNFKVDAESKHLDGQLKWGYNGPALTAAYTFGHKGWER